METIVDLAEKTSHARTGKVYNAIRVFSFPEPATVVTIAKPKELRENNNVKVLLNSLYYSTTGNIVFASYNEPGSFTEEFLFICPCFVVLI